jgi:MFS family permease
VKFTGGVTATATALAFLDPVIVAVALPALGEQLRADISGLQWTVVAYALGVAVFTLTGSGMGEPDGHRRTRLGGLAVFGLAAVAAAAAPTIEVLVAARLAQGIGAAFVISAGRIQARAVAVAGPVVSGLLVSVIGWRAVFVAAAVVALVALIPHRRREPRKAHHTRLDVAGLALLGLGLTGLSVAFISVPREGVGSFLVWSAALLGLLGLIACGLVERRRGRPGVGISDGEGRPRIVAMVPPGLLSSLTLYTFLVYAALGGLVFFLLIQLQTVAEYPPWAAGLAILPATAILLALAESSRVLAVRLGPGRQLVLGPLVLGAGMLLLYRIGPDAVYWRDVLPGAIVTGFGLAVFLPPLAAAAQPAYAVHVTAARTGQLLAVAVLPMLAGLAGAAYANPAAFHHGFRVALVFGAAVLVAASLVALGGAVRRRPPLRSTR